MADLTRVTKGDLWRDDKGGVWKVTGTPWKVRAASESGEEVFLSHRRFRERFKPYVLVAKPIQDEYIVSAITE